MACLWIPHNGSPCWWQKERPVILGCHTTNSRRVICSTNQTKKSKDVLWENIKFLSLARVLLFYVRPLSVCSLFARELRASPASCKPWRRKGNRTDCQGITLIAETWMHTTFARPPARTRIISRRTRSVLISRDCFKPFVCYLSAKVQAGYVLFKRKSRINSRRMLRLFHLSRQVLNTYDVPGQPRGR